MALLVPSATLWMDRATLSGMRSAGGSHAAPGFPSALPSSRPPLVPGAYWNARYAFATRKSASIDTLVLPMLRTARKSSDESSAACSSGECICSSARPARKSALPPSRKKLSQIRSAVSSGTVFTYRQRNHCRLISWNCRPCSSRRACSRGSLTRMSCAKTSWSVCAPTMLAV